MAYTWHVSLWDETKSHILIRDPFFLCPLICQSHFVIRFLIRWNLISQNRSLSFYLNSHFKGQLVYQLIFSKNRISTLEPLKGFIDETYSPVRSESKHRSIRLIKPTIQLHGPYTCRVDAITKDDAPSVTKKAHLVVYCEYFSNISKIT